MNSANRVSREDGEVEMSIESDSDPTLVQRRVVVGTRGDEDRSTVLSDSLTSPQVRLPNVNVTELWKLFAVPAPLSAADDGCGGEFQLTPPQGGCTVRMVELPPDAWWKGRSDASVAAVTGDEDGFHQTDTIDLVVITQGEVCCRLDEGEVVLGTGDVLIQVGTNHAWSVRGTGPCRMISVLFDGRR